MKRIVIDGVIFGLQKAGGISRFWVDTLLGLEETFAKEHFIYLLIPPNHNIEWEGLASRLKNIKIIKRRPFRWNKRGFYQESLYLTALAFRLRPWIWHGSYYVGLPLKFCKHTIHSFYDMIPEVLGETSPYDSLMKYRALKTAKTIVAISSHSKKDLSSIWPECQDKIDVIPLCVSKDHASKKKLDIEIPLPYFLFLGNRGGYKNFLTLLEVLLPDTRFKKYHVIVVGGENGFVENEQKLIEQFQAHKRVHHLGTLPTHDVEILIKGCETLLYPSIYEGFGLPVLEAFSNEVPVLACRCSSIPEITGDEYPLADPNTPSTFLDVLAILQQEKTKWVAYGKARKLLFTHSKMIEAFCDLYTKNFKSIAK